MINIKVARTLTSNIVIIECNPFKISPTLGDFGSMIAQRILMFDALLSLNRKSDALPTELPGLPLI